MVSKVKRYSIQHQPGRW